MLSEKCFQSLEVDVTPDVFQTLPFTLLALDSARRTKDSKCFPVSVFIPANLTSIVTKTAISCVFFIALFYNVIFYWYFLLRTFFPYSISFQMTKTQVNELIKTIRLNSNSSLLICRWHRFIPFRKSFQFYYMICSLTFNVWMHFFTLKLLQSFFRYGP